MHTKSNLVTERQSSEILRLLRERVVNLPLETRAVTARTADAARKAIRALRMLPKKKISVLPLILTLRGGAQVEVVESEGWLFLKALDGVLTVRPLDERTVYLRPVGRMGGWMPTTYPARGVQPR